MNKKESKRRDVMKTKGPQKDEKGPNGMKNKRANNRKAMSC